jgi:L-ribulose-5-phosphate 3-epimerase UlaE
MAASKGVVLGFETMETPFMDTVAKSMAQVRAVGSPWLGVYPDLGNLTNAALIYGQPVTDDLKVGAGHIFACHLKETTPGVYRDLDFGCGHTDYESGVAVLWYQGVRMFTAECWYRGEADWQKKLSQVNVFLREKIINGAIKGAKGA